MHLRSTAHMHSDEIDGPGQLYIAPLTDFDVSLSDQTGPHMVLCPVCWLLTKAGTSFLSQRYGSLLSSERERECV